MPWAWASVSAGYWFPPDDASGDVALFELHGELPGELTEAPLRRQVTSGCRVDGYPQPGDNFNFVPYQNPDNLPHGEQGGSWVVAADLVVMFNPTPVAKELVRFLVSKEAQKLLPGEGKLSAHTDVALDKYPNQVSQRITEVLTGGDTVCFDASDVMPATIRHEFNRAVQEYPNDLNDPEQLEALLHHLRTVQDTSPTSQGELERPRLQVSCAR